MPGKIVLYSKNKTIDCINQIIEEVDKGRLRPATTKKLLDSK